MKKTLFICINFSLLGLFGCTTINVSKINSSTHPINLICIEENPAVQVDDILSVIEQSIRRRNIRTLVYKKIAPPQCDYTLWYTAYRGWDLAPFMNRAELRLSYKGETIATANYRHSGGFALNKWAGTDTKLQPMLDELLGDFQLSPK
jgi:hypothetical protein